MDAEFVMPSLEECIKNDKMEIVDMLMNCCAPFSKMRDLKEKRGSASAVYDLLYVIEKIKAVATVEASSESGVYPGYALEKLQGARRTLDSVINYFSSMEVKK